MLGEIGSPNLTIGGISDGAPQRQPAQIGRSGSPCSNSTQTPAPIGGKTNTPIGGPVGPASGTQDSAQLDGVNPKTSGTWISNRPVCIGSMLFSTVPRYLP